MSEKRRLELVIEIDGKHCGAGCELGDGKEWCQTGHLDYDWQERKYRRSDYCKANAREVSNGED
jgi:hypothetical protein